MSKSTQTETNFFFLPKSNLNMQNDKNSDFD